MSFPGGASPTGGRANPGPALARRSAQTHLIGPVPVATAHQAEGTRVLIIAGSILVDPRSRTDYLAGCRPVVQAARNAPGCLDFSLAADLLEEGRINVYERWESDADLMSFRDEGPSFDQADQILEARVSKYRIAAVEEA